MLFNSHLFLFAFLPAVLLVFFALGARSRGLAMAWLTAASLFFYAWWRPLNVLLIAPSIAVNFGLARLLLRSAGTRRADALLALGVVFNLCFLGWFKYANFLGEIAHDLTGAGFVARELILPLGLSFITFQKIAFLVDVHGGRVTEVTLARYGLFVLFFPQLVAGPIVHYRELMPQFERASGRFDGEAVAAGLTLFGIGLFKKVVLADTLAGYVSPLYDAAAAGQPLTLAGGWLAALGFTLQIYFDFSGYSDMALGLARLFGVRLPANFDSPLKAGSIIDFWLRWHMTLTRFLTAYLYNPLVLWLTRRRMAAGRPALGGRGTTAGAFVALLAGPTLLTMLVSGVWHGAGYGFVLWGLLHGAYLVVNHAWRIFGARRWPAVQHWLPGRTLTLVAVAVAMVLFRAPTLASAGAVLSGMAGLHGFGLPAAIAERLPALHGVVQVSRELSATDLVALSGLVAALLAAVLVLPNSLQLMSRFEPSLTKPRPAGGWALGAGLAWAPTLRWAAALALVTGVAVYRLGGASEFLYWQF